MHTQHDWTLAGADGQAILGNTHKPANPQATVIVCHGFKGYKDYGFFPRLAGRLAEEGLIVLRFNFSHSGMTNDLATFARPDLFERDTWGKQIFDLQQVAQAADAGELPGTAGCSARPILWLGHSRGGVGAILAAARVFAGAGGQGVRPPAGVIALATPHQACHLDADQRRLLHRQGFLPSPSSRTGQELRLGLAWLEEMERDPAAFDLEQAVKRLGCPLHLIHGQADETVPPASSDILARAAGGRAVPYFIEQAGHTFNCPNPLPDDQPLPAATAAMFDAVVKSIRACLAGRFGPLSPRLGGGRGLG